MKPVFLLFFVLSLTACATSYREPGQVERPAAKAVLANADSMDEKEDGERIYCTKEPTLGTRLPKRRVCKTAEEWQRIADESQDATRDIQRLGIPVLSN